MAQLVAGWYSSIHGIPSLSYLIYFLYFSISFLNTTYMNTYTHTRLQCARPLAVSSGDCNWRSVAVFVACNGLTVHFCSHTYNNKNMNILLTHLISINSRSGGVHGFSSAVKILLKIRSLIYVCALMTELVCCRSYLVLVNVKMKIISHNFRPTSVGVS